MTLPRNTRDTTTRRNFVTTGAALLLAGCTPGPTITNAYSAARNAVLGAPDAPVTKEYVANLPYASIGARIGRGQRSMLVLGRYDGPDRHWISADRGVLVTRNGRLIRAYGIGADLRDTSGLENDPVAAATFKFEGFYQRVADIGTPAHYGATIQSRFELLGPIVAGRGLLGLGLSRRRGGK